MTGAHPSVSDDRHKPPAPPTAHPSLRRIQPPQSANRTAHADPSQDPSTSSARHTPPTSYRDTGGVNGKASPAFTPIQGTRMASLRLIATKDVLRGGRLMMAGTLENFRRRNLPIKADVNSFFHPCGTAAISPKGSGVGKGEGVVDSELKVKTVTGLRVADAAVIPYVPTAHTQAAVYTLAERAADLIKEAWK
ncbi:GMC oxidoreductase-domain-containing protein [Ephemerocybe angulata]|uniref:GMC oxidoreductase-domain-containing protein n=1 Tax=Ephemerocybe angulata TaxID=980116 RepID=A0A8H6M7R3_9AGAR|nr:GMC oxidoreductase-domain-containing protein [Tulosesus angulatus]